MGVPNRMSDGEADRDDEGRPGGDDVLRLPSGDRGRGAAPVPPRPRWTTTIPVLAVGGRPYTIITRSFRPEHVGPDGFVTWAGCATHESVATVFAPGHLTPEQAAVYSTGIRPATDD
jgi:hypothetical protein